ncbi:tetratricopeptide repeat protein, partial [Acidobacteria bacterium AH-259-O06]|nr:tetratricopeptide repeat protein [Acidobacteria bacterium AH-259-O06]
QDLGVDYVLEGTVRWEQRADGTSRVRVTPQLIQVSSDAQLWSDRYDRVMEEIFAVQSEIATQVVQQLGIALLQPDRKALEARPTENLQAYQAFLQGKNIMERLAGLFTDLHRAVQMFERAVELDPSFALAWAELSRTHSGLYHWRQDLTEERLTKARQAADKALKLQPDLPAAHVALGYYYYWGRKDYERALEELTLAAKGQKNNADVLEAVGFIRRRQGRWDEAVANLKSAFQLNPLSTLLAGELANTYAGLRKYPEAERYADIAISLAPDLPYGYAGKAQNYLAWKGDTQLARATMERMPETNEPWILFFWVYLDLFEGKYQDALDRLAVIPVETLEDQESFLPKTLMAGLIHGLRSEPELAHDSCDSARKILEKEAQARPRDPRVHASLGLAYACLGRKDKAILEATLATDLYPISRDALGGPGFLQNLALVYAMVGEYDSALDQLDHLLSMPAGPSITVLRIDPNWTSLHDHPRFQKLMEKYR